MNVKPLLHYLEQSLKMYKSINFVDKNKMSFKRIDMIFCVTFEILYLPDKNIKLYCVLRILIDEKCKTVFANRSTTLVNAF